MSTEGATSGRKPLGERLVQEALLIVAERGPAGLSLREVQRRAAVSPAAAYRHFPDRDGLLLAVAQEAAGLLATHLASAIDQVPRVSADLTAARHRLRVACEAYIEFATRNPGLYRTIFYIGEQLDELTAPSERARGEAGDGGYNILLGLLADVSAASGDAPASPWEAVAVWSTLHGLAMLRLDAALRTLPEEEFRRARDHVLAIVTAAVPAPDPSPLPSPSRFPHL